MVGRARGESIPSSCGRVNHHVVVLRGRFHVVDAGQEEPIAVIIDVIFDGVIFIGWRQEAEVAADGRPAGRRGAGEELWKREHVEADEHAAERELRAQEALSVDDGSPCLAYAATDGERARHRHTAEYIGEHVLRQERRQVAVFLLFHLSSE
jgi:hypothetical protein